MKSYIFMMLVLHLSLVSPMTPCNPVKCFVDPCTNFDCPSDTECVANYCNGCNAECKPCDLVNCFVNPCNSYKCPIGSYCVPNYCNSCHAVCKQCPTIVCKPCTLQCLNGGRCIVKESCGQCLYSCSNPLINSNITKG